MMLSKSPKELFLMGVFHPVQPKGCCLDALGYIKPTKRHPPFCFFFFTLHISYACWAFGLPQLQGITSTTSNGSMAKTRISPGRSAGKSPVMVASKESDESDSSGDELTWRISEKKSAAAFDSDEGSCRFFVGPERGVCYIIMSMILMDHYAIWEWVKTSIP